MQTPLYIFLASSTIIFSTTAFAQDACVTKKHSLQQQINSAKKQGNKQKIINLNNALNDLNASCKKSVAPIHRITAAPSYKDVQKCELDVLDAQRALKAAQLHDDFDSVPKKQEGLRKAQYKLSEAKAGLLAD